MVRVPGPTGVFVLVEVRPHQVEVYSPALPKVPRDLLRLRPCHPSTPLTPTSLVLKRESVSRSNLRVPGFRGPRVKTRQTVWSIPGTSSSPPIQTSPLSFLGGVRWGLISRTRDFGLLDLCLRSRWKVVRLEVVYRNRQTRRQRN